MSEVITVLLTIALYLCWSLLVVLGALFVNYAVEWIFLYLDADTDDSEGMGTKGEWRV